jgi:multidrug efflux pump
MSTKLLRFVQIVKNDPDVAHVVGFTGGGGGGSPTDQGRMFVTLKPWSNGPTPPTRSSPACAPQCARVPGATCIFNANQDLRIGGRMSSAQYQYTIQSDTLQDLVKWGPILLDNMKKLPGMKDVFSDQQNDGLESSLTYDRPTAMRLG